MFSSRTTMSCGLFALAFILAGCPKLVSIDLPTQYVPDGIVYYLPMLELEVNLKRELQRCGFSPPIPTGKGKVTTSDKNVTGIDTEFSRLKSGDIIRIGKEDRIIDSVTSNNQLKTTEAFPNVNEPTPYMGPVDPQTKYAFDIRYSAVVTPHLIPDATRPLYIPYNKLNGLMKQTNLTFELYENGTLKSINSSITDKTDEVILNLTKSGVAIAKMVAGLPPLPRPTEKSVPSTPRTPQDPLCKTEIQNALTNIPNLKKNISSLSETVLTQEVILLNLQQQVAGGAGNSAAITTARENLRISRETLTDLKSGLAREQSVLIDEQVKIIRPRLGRLIVDQASGQKTIQGELLAELIVEPPQLRQKWFNEVPSKIQDVKDKLDKSLSAYWALYLPTINPIQAAEKADRIIGQEQQGLIYRQGVSGEFMICYEGPCVDNNQPIALRDKRIYTDSLIVPQLGVLATLPVTNRPFGTNTLVAAFSPNGVLTKLTFTSEAAAAKATATMVEALPSISSFLEQKRGAETADLNREKEKVQAQTELEKARKQLEEVQADK